MKKIITGTIIALIALAIVAGTLLFLNPGKRGQSSLAFQKGMCYTTWSKGAYSSVKSDESLEKLKGLNVGYVSVLTTWYQDNCFSTEIFPTEKTPSDQSIKHAVEKIHSLGMKAMIKPHLDILSAEYGSWRGEITCIKETDWDRWFKSYKNFIMHYAKLAEETNAELLCIGTELASVTAKHSDEWRNIIAAIRNVYKGMLTYAANWSEEYLQIRFWDALDYAGIDAYFPLSNEEKPTYDEIMKGWERWVPEIENWQAGINKPVIFPEVGYHSASGAARQPWEHGFGINVDTELQVDCYKALVDTFWNKDWFYGVYWWDWGTSVKMGGKSNRGFTPQNKPAEDYVGELYSKGDPR